MTLDEFNQSENWPIGSHGFRLPRGRAVWTCVRYTEGGTVGRMEVSRIVHEGGQTFTRCSYPAPETSMIFVDSHGQDL